MRSTRTCTGAFFLVLLCSSEASFAFKDTDACAEYTASTIRESTSVRSSSFLRAGTWAGFGELADPDRMEPKNDVGFFLVSSFSELSFSLAAA